MSSLTSLLRNASYLASVPFISTALGFLSSVIVVRTLGLQAYGLFAFLMAYCAIVGSLTSFRTTEAVARYYVPTGEQESVSLNHVVLKYCAAVQLASRGFAVILIAALTPLVVGAGWFGATDELCTLAPLFAATLLLELLDPIWVGIATSERRFRAVALTTSARDLVRVATIVGLWTADQLSLATLTLAYVVGSATVCVLNVWLVGAAWRQREADGRVPQALNSREELRPIWRFLTHGYFASIATTSIKQGDVLLLSAFRPQEEVGIYRVAKSLASLVQSTVGAVAQVTYADLNALVRAGRFAEILTVAGILSRKVGLVLFGMLVVAGLLAGPAIPLLYGPELSASYPVFLVLLGGTAVTTLLFWAHPLALSLERADLILKINLVNVLVFYGIGTTLTQEFGVYAVASALSFAWAFGYLILLFTVRAHLLHVTQRDHG